MKKQLSEHPQTETKKEKGKEGDILAHENYPFGSTAEIGSRDRSLYEHKKESFIAGYNTLAKENKELKEIVNNASTLSSKDVRLSIVDTKSSGSAEVETSKVKRADKFVVSFVVQNSIAQFNNAEVIIVITAPDGQIVTNTVWDSGVFDSKKEGRKVYTRKLKFEYARNEEKRLIFTLDYAEFMKGVYKMQLYHNGVQIGEASKELN